MHLLEIPEGLYRFTDKNLKPHFYNFAWLTIEVQIILHIWAHFSGALQNVDVMDVPAGIAKSALTLSVQETAAMKAMHHQLAHG